jgi:hypothetical protein
MNYIVILIHLNPHFNLNIIIFNFFNAFMELSHFKPIPIKITQKISISICNPI